MLDATNIQRGLLFKNLKELDILNRIAGGHSISLHGLKQLITDRHKIYHIVDLGCGSGDALKVFADWARINRFSVKLTGVDMNAHAIDYLKVHCSDYEEIVGICADYNDFLIRNNDIDVIHCSLFCHHLKEDELLRLFSYFRQQLSTGFIINDLQRNGLAYYSAWLFTRLFNGTQLAKNDGPVSVLRGFKTGELISLLNQAKIMNYSILKKPMFRFLIVGKTQ